MLRKGGRKDGLGESPSSVSSPNSRSLHLSSFHSSPSWELGIFRAGPASLGSRQKAISEIPRKWVTLPEGLERGEWPNPGPGRVSAKGGCQSPGAFVKGAPCQLPLALK